MLEFELKRSKKGKRSRWAKKYPRKSMKTILKVYEAKSI